MSTPTFGIPLSITGQQRWFGECVGFLGGMVMKPTPVLGTHGLIGPPKEVTLFLGTAHIQSIGVLGGMTLLQRGGFTAKALQTTPHVQHFWMRLTIHSFHIVGGLILTTKQQTRLHGTFHILPSFLRLTCLQTHVMARTYQIVHCLSFIVVFDLMIVHLIVKHGHQGELRWWWWCRLLHHVIQFFHHIFHRGSGVFHHLANHRITVLRRHYRVILLLLLLLRGNAFG